MLRVCVTRLVTADVDVTGGKERYNLRQHRLQEVKHLVIPLHILFRV